MIEIVSLEQLNKFLVNTKSKILPKGEVLLELDEPVEQVVFLEEGYVRHYTFSVEGEEFTHNILKPHSLFPIHLALIEQTNPHYFETLTKVRVKIVESKQIINELIKEPELLLALTKKLAAGLNQTTFRVESLLFGDARQRVAAVLVLMGKRFGRAKSRGSLPSKQQIVIDAFSITHQLLASITALTRETVSLEMMALKKEGLIDYQRQKVEILDIEKLREASSLPFYL